MSDVKLTRSQQKRQAILDAAKRAFQEQGVQGTSMDALASLAQVSKRTVYNHFATKEALVMQLITELWQRAMQQIDVAYDPTQALQPQLSAVVEAEIEAICSKEYLELARVALGHLFYHPDALQKEMQKISAQETAITRWLRAAAEDGKLKPLDIEFASGQLHNLFKGHCFWPQLLKMAPVLDPRQRQELADSSVAMFLSYYQKRSG